VGQQERTGTDVAGLERTSIETSPESEGFFSKVKEMFGG